MPKPELKTSSSVTARFSAAASTYHRNTKIQRLVAKELMALLASAKPHIWRTNPGLPPLPAPARILEIGCGTGVLTGMLAKTFPLERIDAIDVSRAMTVKARKNLSGNRMIKWIVADACQLPENAKCPLIISNCTLHWIAPIKMIIRKLGAMLEPGGTLAFAVMTHGTFAELNASRGRIAPHKPSRVVMPSKDEIKNAVLGANLRISKQKSEIIRQEYHSVEKMLKQLHDQGLTGGNVSRNNLLLTRSEISRLIADYEKKYRAGHGVYATYRVYYCVAVKRSGKLN